MQHHHYILHLKLLVRLSKCRCKFHWISGSSKNEFDRPVLSYCQGRYDGFELYEEIRKIDNKVKVCFITAFEVNYQALRAVFPSATTTDDIGCFIRKPVDVDKLLKHIEAILI
jgi:DNA-binding NtrC family response regulator